MKKNNKLTIVLKTARQLSDEGFKPGYYWYLGDRKHPERKILSNYVELYGGKTLEVVEIQPDGGKITFQGIEKRVCLDYSFFIDGIKILKLHKKPKVLFLRGKRDRDSEAKYFEGHGFHFSCDLSELKTSEARKLAQWVLKVSK